jgi:Ribonuclease G/E
VKGRQILIEPLATGGHAAALMVDGILEDLLIDAPYSDPTPRVEEIRRAIVGRPLKGIGGTIVDLGNGLTGFLRTARPPAPGTRLLVQVTGSAEAGKAPPVTDRIRIKGRLAILTPGRSGLNISRSIRDPERRTELDDVAQGAMSGADAKLGLILRSAAEVGGDDEIADEVAKLRQAWDAVANVAGHGIPELLLKAPGAAATAWREWKREDVAVISNPKALADQDVWEAIAALRDPFVPLPTGGLFIEPTRALVAVDVNTGGDTSPAAALKANIAAMRELPRQLRLRGLGGQVVVDPAPIAKTQRRMVEEALAGALRRDGVETSIAGWTPLGHLEINRKRDRPPLV